MSEQNPFLVPGSAQGRGYEPSGRTVDAGRSIEWLRLGWQLFTKNPGIWIAIAVIILVILVVLGSIPVVGHLAANFLMPVFAAGTLLGCKALQEGGELRIDHLFAGFKQNTGNLIMVGLFYLIGVAAVWIIGFTISGGGAITGAMMGRGPGMGMAVGGFLLGALVVMALMVPLAMAVWFAPALVVFRNVAPADAMKASFAACLKNLVPFLVYGVILFVLIVIAMIPLGLGLLILVPVMMGSVYASYVEIFE